MTIKEFIDDEKSSTQAIELNANLQKVHIQSVCKNLLKDVLFRGLYKERRYVEQLQKYRDKIYLHSSEKEIKNKLSNVVCKLLKFYDQQKWPLPWINISDNIVNTCIWTELKDLAFGEYWFMITKVKFLSNEVIVHVKVVRPIETEELNTVRSKAYPDKHTNENDKENNSYNNSHNLIPQINWIDFLELPSIWLQCTKNNIYYFLSQDLNMANIKKFVKFLNLLLISLVTGLFVFIKFLGYFIIRFMGELSNLLSALTPIAIKIIDVCSKIIGGLFILLAMIYNDCFGRNHSTSHRKEFYYQALPSPRRPPNNWRY